MPQTAFNEVCTALIKFIENPELTSVQLCKWVKGPDFPTGAHEFIPLNPSDTFPSTQSEIYLVFKLVSDSFEAVLVFDAMRKVANPFGDGQASRRIAQRPDARIADASQRIRRLEARFVEYDPGLLQAPGQAERGLATELADDAGDGAGPGNVGDGERGAGGVDGRRGHAPGAGIRRAGRGPGRRRAGRRLRRGTGGAALLAAALIGSLVLQPAGLMPRVLSHPWLAGPGRDLSYAMYLWHIPALYDAAAEIGRQRTGARVLDIPCGGGVALRGLRPGQGVEYVAADIAQAA